MREKKPHQTRYFTNNPLEKYQSIKTYQHKHREGGGITQFFIVSYQRNACYALSLQTNQPTINKIILAFARLKHCGYCDGFLRPIERERNS